MMQNDDLYETLALVTALLKDRNAMNGGDLATETSLSAVATAETLLAKLRAARTVNDQTMHDVCECGDYRFQHWRGTGPCIFNNDDPTAPGLGHNGADNCYEFRLAIPQAEALKESK